MLRRTAVLACLLLPAVGRAASSGGIDLSDGTFGKSDCTATSTSETVTWNVAFVSGNTAVPVGSTFSVFANGAAFTASTCTASSGTPTTLASGQAADSTSATPTVGTTSVSPSRLITAAGLASCAADGTIYLCVALLNAGGTTIGVAQSSALTLQVEPPPVPTGVSAVRGDGALYVSWQPGTGASVAAASYDVTATAVTPGSDTGSPHKKNFTSTSNQRFGGLTNGVTYAVQVASVSEGGNVSAQSSDLASAPTATPTQVLDFWDQYVKAGGTEQGGCAGGAGGLLSLLAAAGLARMLRRRS
jgi:hypothetical protein